MVLPPFSSSHGYFSVSGPIVSAVSNIFSFRSLVLVGSAMSFCSVLACAFVNDVNVFIVLFGFVTGESVLLIAPK